MQSTKCSAFMPPFAKQKGEFGEEANAAILPMASRLASLSTLHPIKKGFIVRKHGRTLGGQTKEIFTNDSIWCIGNQSQDMLSSCGLRAASHSVSSEGCSQCHLLSAEWQHRANLNYSTPEEYRCQPSQKRTWSWHEQKVFDQSEVEPQASWRAGPGRRSFSVADVKMTRSIACSPQRKVLHCGSAGAWMGFCAARTARWLTLYCDREKELVTAVLLKPAKPWEFPEQWRPTVLTQWNCFWSCRCPLSSLERQLFQNIERYLSSISHDQRFPGWYQVFQYYNILW